MTKDYGEIICTAVDEIVRARISSLEFNVTKTCTIIDISSRKQGKYGVSDGSVSFIALSEDTTYNLDDSVLVLIPNGDYKNDKLILSKINKETELPYNYTSPMSMMVTLTDNVLNNLKYDSGLLAESGGLLANEPAAVDEKIGTSVVLYDFNQNLDWLNGFTRIGLSVDFKSLLNNLNVHSGTYGIFIQIYSKAGEQGAEKELVTVLPFNCNEMAGNPYNFTSFFTQEKVFDISYIQNIQRIQVVFYQGADFKDAQGNLVPYQYTEFPNNTLVNSNDNLFVTNVKMYFGQGVNEFDKETITLYTNDVPSYHYTRNNDKILNIRWVHKVNDNAYIPLSGAGLDTSKYEVRWYRYNSATTNIDEYAGEGWERIDGLAANTFSIKFTPDIKNIKEKIKVIGIVRDGSVIAHSSNILELINEEYVPDQAIFDVSSGLSIGCLDDTAGNYYLYDQNGYLNNNGLGQGYTRVMAPLWNGAQINYDTFSGKKVDFVEWWFPASGTMTICEEKDVTQPYNGIEYKVFRYVPGADWDKNDITFDYSIKNYWAKKESNNTIRCIVSVNGTEYSALKELQFGRAGSNGTNLTMVLEFSGNNNALIIDGDPIQVEARLYDSNGSRIDFTKDQAINGITWDWYKSTPEDENYGPYMTHSANEDNATRTITLNSALGGPPVDNYFILQATYKADILSTELTAFLPIPIKMAECSHIEGAKEVIYNHQGTPSYYKDAYKAFKRENKEYKEYENLEWTCTSTNDDFSLTPHLSNGNSGGLVAPQFFVDGQSDQVCVRCEYWSQPILIMQSKYDFALLNSWDESLTIDEKNGTILSTMLGAGKKVNNVFSGVLIGDLLAGTDLQTAPRNTGIYGFSEGQMSFGFKDDGTAFIGKSGKGQILFDGNQGTIKSNNIDLTVTTENGKEIRTITGTGLLLDMDDAHISIRGQSVPNSKKTYFDVWRNNNELIHISDGGYYLQSAEYGLGKGFKIDLENGSINANNFALMDSHGHNLLYAGESAYYLQTCGFTDGDENTNPNGMQIDLDSGRIVAYDFTLSSVTPAGNYKGSNLVLSSGDETMGPSMSVHLKNATKNYDLDLFLINDQQFIMKSPTWFEGTTTVTVNTPDKYYCKSGWNIRNGPNGSKIGFVSEGFYTELFEKEGEWQKIKEKDSEDANEWWVYEDAIDTSKKIAGESGEKKIPYGRGLTLNIGEGYLLGYNNAKDINAILLDTRDTNYGLQLGPKDNYNLQLGWDGSLMGGSSFKWSIAKNGEAKFNRLIANGGELKDLEIKNVDISYAYIYSGTIGSCSINKNGISSSAGGWAFTTSGATLPTNVYFGDYKLSVKPVTIMDMWWRPKAANTGGGKGYIVKASSNSINYKDHDGNNQTLTFTTSTFELAYETRWKGTLIGATEISNEGTGG